MIRRALIGTLFFGCIFLDILAQPQNFEGIIKYVPLNSFSAPGDTVIIYFGKHKLRKTRIGKFSEKFGGVTDEIIDFKKAPNQTLVYFGDRGETQMIESKSSGIDSTKTYPDSVQIILGFTCVKSEIYFAEGEFMGSTHRVVDSNWSADCLRYVAPLTAVSSIWHPDNSPGRIPLMQERKIYAQMIDGTEHVRTSVMIACEIIARSLPDSVFLIP